MYNYPSIYGFNRIRYVEQTQKDANLNSVIDADPIYLLEDTNFQFHRTTTNQAQLRYVRNPPEVKWAFILDSNLRPVYDPINSVDPIFDDLFMYEAIMRALMLVGVNLQMNVVMGYAKEIKETGQ